LLEKLAGCPTGARAISCEMLVPKNFRSSALVVIEQANAIIDEYVARGFTLTLRQLYYQFARSHQEQTNRIQATWCDHQSADVAHHGLRRQKQPRTNERRDR
jgi:hypothetical protein